ncbi:HEAT repeat domain-containing protein [Deinococcus marmoris]
MDRISSDFDAEVPFIDDQIREMQLDLHAFINSFDDSEIYDFLTGLFENSDNGPTRSQAFTALVQLPHRQPTDFLEKVLEHADSGWRLAACRTLGDLSERWRGEATQLLCLALLKDADPDVRFCAAESLGKVGNSYALTALQHAREHDQGKDYEGWPVASAAAKAIKAISS